jgi:general secretion pathway protein F
MPVYEYTGVNAAGKKVKGVYDAESPRALRDHLKAQQIFLTEQTEGKSKQERKAGEVRLPFSGPKQPGVREISIMTRQLATLLKAGIPLVEALTALVEQSEDEALKKVIAEVRQRVNEGSALHLALADHPKVFSDLFVNMVKAGEASGNLDLVLVRLTDFLDEQVTLRNKITAAMFYPIIMMVFGTAIVGYLMKFVIPQITKLFDDQKDALPFITVVLVAVSNFVSSFWWLILLAGFGSWRGFQKWKATPAGRRKWDETILKLPVFGIIARMVAVSRFSKTMSTLLASGVPLLTAMDIVKSILGNVVLIEVVEQARLNIREGESIAVPLRRSGQFPPMVTHMIAVGERTGALEEMLDNVADAYSEQVSARIQGLTTLMEPLIMLLMGGVVGFIVFAVLLPILQLNESLTK